ncbi:putative sperm flagellar protein 1 isoform 2 [Scophthalmus maximus]|uniref:Putative sperm flagellar protein 1 isoform 2 n=2 Tax=Scophthalmus maximus TaxID=52904 RepID=A0A2U9CBX8_SCOMX|nr:sperm flagellar protein 1 isoform X2 [Scophthalmus maximus]AWP14075.1 putative sperm flagellar protein 1 isoform 2 [Scophthalmus maximus]
MSRELNEEELQELYAWIDKVPLSRPKRNITRDFSDGVMAAEVAKHFFPKLVDLHNYIPANSTAQKLSNWNLLNRKVFSKMNFHVPEETVKRIVLSAAGVIEPVLSTLREKIDKKLEHTTDNILDLEYFDTRNHEQPHAEIHQTEVAQLRGGDMKKDDKRRQRNCKPEHTVEFYTDMDPTLRIILQEKEQAVMGLQETVEILQMKVSRLEHLVHLKDMRIDELTRHLETYKTKGNPR